MPTVDFYLIDVATLNEQLRFACRLLDKAYLQQYTAYVHVENRAVAETMYDLLWTFRDISFVPHDLMNGPNSADAPVIIGSDEKPLQQHDILLNLHTSVPEFYSAYNRVVEIVHQDAAWQKIARKHYKFYQNQGHEVKTHDLRKP
ncbi:MAG: DNA polymerase III subunit chi [Gammaproteobacteria bacterium]|jgi:DNA polymerase-3 subunit chi